MGNHFLFAKRGGKKEPESSGAYVCPECGNKFRGEFNIERHKKYEEDQKKPNE